MKGCATAVHGNKHQGPWIVRKFLGPIILGRVLRQRRMKAGIKVPKWWLPGPTHDESEEVSRFRADASAFQALKSEPFPHPFFGHISKAQWNDLVLIHAAHHLGFLLPNS